jgi:hypothetical protein
MNARSRYYICDDCSGAAGRSNATYSSWDSNLLLAEAYRVLRTIDPFHITVGAMETSDLWSFSDSTGALSVDVPLVENYGGTLVAHAAGDSRFDRWPMDWGPVVNCGWGEAIQFHTYAGTITPQQLRSDAFLGVIGGMTAGQLWYGLTEGTEPELVSAMMRVSSELQELAPSLFAPLRDSTSTPSVAVTATPALPGSTNSNRSNVIARAWSEAPAAGAGVSSYCVWVAAVNVSPEPVLATLVLSNTSLMARVPPSATLTTPFDQVFTDPSGLETIRSVPLSTLAPGGERSLRDVILGGATAVYRLGCELPMAAESPTENLVNNPSFEDFVVAGRPSGWGLVDGNDGRDLRAGMSLDLDRPRHGRHSVRVIVPTDTPLVVPFSAPYTGAFGLSLAANKSYAVELWARSSGTAIDNPSALMVEVLNGTWSNIENAYGIAHRQ